MKYLYCRGCGLLQTEAPYWIEEAYTSAIADADTGLVQRSLAISRRLACLLYFLVDSTGSYLDYAGGYGLLTRLMRDIGFDFYWSDKYCSNVFARGFDLSTVNPPFVAVTAFEVLEHVYDPLSFLKEALSLSGAKTIVFSTELYGGELPPRPNDWWYYAFSTGQHISFYHKRTLNVLAERLGMTLYSNNGLHILTRAQISDGYFRFVTSRMHILMFPYVAKRMTSRTFQDHETLIARPPVTSDHK